MSQQATEHSNISASSSEQAWGNQFLVSQSKDNLPSLVLRPLSTISEAAVLVLMVGWIYEVNC
jgi:hypothetical protein